MATDVVEQYHRGEYVPEALRPWMRIALSHLNDGQFTGAIRGESTETLKVIARTIAAEATTDHFADVRAFIPDVLPDRPIFEIINLPTPRFLHGDAIHLNFKFWVDQVLPAINKEIDHRQNPPTYKGKSFADLKQQLNIVEVVAQRVMLQKAGRGYKGLCPFHEEKTPSFYVWEESQRWKCFGACATGGDVIDFMKKAGDV